MLSRLRPSVSRKRSDDDVLPTHHVVPSPTSNGANGSLNDSVDDDKDKDPSSRRRRRARARTASRRARAAASGGGGGVGAGGPGVIRAVPHGVPPGSFSYDDAVVLPGEAMCTSFLLGGAYYPGKDKRGRSQLKRAALRRTVWYRAMCSTRRRVAITVALSLVGCVYVGGPTVGYVLEWGAYLAGRGGPSDLYRRNPKLAERARLEDLFPEWRGRIRSEEEYARDSKLILDAAEKGRWKKNDGDGRDRTDLVASLDPALYDFVNRNGPRTHLDEGSRKKGDPLEGEEVGKAPGEDDETDDETDEDPLDRRQKAEKNDAEDENDDGDERAGDDEDIQEIAQDAEDEEDGDGSDRDDEGGDEDLAELARDDAGGDGGGGANGDGGADGDGGVGIGGEGADGGGKEEGADNYALLPDKRDKPKRRMDGPNDAAGAARTLHNVDSLPPSSSCPPSGLPPSEISVTLVTQTTLDRAFLLEHSCVRWGADKSSNDGGGGNPMVSVVFLPTEHDFSEWKTKVRPNLEAKCPGLELVEYLVEEGDEEGKSGHYPINKLRNLGLDRVQTSHVLVLDADFVPSADLAGTVREALGNEARRRRREIDAGDEEKEDESGGDERDAFIVPVFDRRPPSSSNGHPCSTPDECSRYLKDDPHFLPATFDDLIECALSDGEECIPFQSDVNNEGHFTTRSDDWLEGMWYDDQFERWGARKKVGGDANDRGKDEVEDLEEIDPDRAIRRVRCFDTMRYEPWTAVRWCPSSSDPAIVSNSGGDVVSPRPVAPYYDERFSGYGKNKIEWVSHLRFSGYRFRVLPRAFAVHHPHPESRHKEVWNDAEGKDLHARMDELYPQFLAELRDRYKDGGEGGRSIVPSCSQMRKKEGQARRRKGDEEDA